MVNSMQHGQVQAIRLYVNDVAYSTVHLYIIPHCTLQANESKSLQSAYSNARLPHWTLRLRRQSNVKSDPHVPLAMILVEGVFAHLLAAYSIYSTVTQLPQRTPCLSLDRRALCRTGCNLYSFKMQNYAQNEIVMQLDHNFTHFECKITHFVQELLFRPQRGVLLFLNLSMSFMPMTLVA